MKYESCECPNCQVSYNTDIKQIHTSGNCPSCSEKLILKAIDSKGRRQTIIRKLANELDTKDLLVLPGKDFESEYFILDVKIETDKVRVSIKNYRRIDCSPNQIFSCIIGA